MKLTGKAEEDFNNWLELEDLINPNKIHGIIPNSDTINFYRQSMLWGVYVDFFDSKGFYIDVITELEMRRGQSGFELAYHNKPNMWYFIINSDSEQLSVGISFDSRKESRKAAIEKANEIYNGKF